jgi:hypothetical protein
MSDTLIRVETKRYYHREDGSIIMKIEEDSFLGMKDGEEMWHHSSISIPLYQRKALTFA